MKKISIVCEKGGTAKTTLASNLAAGLAEQGYKVMLIDGDSQGHSTLAMRQRRSSGLANLLLRNAPYRDVVQQVDPSLYGGGDGLLLLLPGGPSTRKLYEELTNSLALRNRLSELDGYIDYVVMDTAPSITKLLTAMYFASDKIIFPTQCEFYSIEGLMNSISHLQKSQEMGAERGIQVGESAGVVPTMFNGRESVQHQNYGYLQGTYGRDNVLSPIKQRTAWKQANQMRSPVFRFDSTSPAAKEARRFIEEVGARV
jgi:chromosome partitioning protein